MLNTILIVDDNADLRKLVRMTLLRSPFQLIEAASGDEALGVIREIRPQIVVLDVMMPGLHDGYDVCRIVKNDPDLASIKIILLTARGQQADLEMGRQVGADEYLVKPFSPAELLRKINLFEIA
jgi:two-component system, OmpR family, phosphate regulon response regulator PhoB